MNYKVRYPILSINGMAVLLAYYFQINNPLVILWGWSIWGLIYYEHIEFLGAIADSKYNGVNKVVVIINASTQFLFTTIYSYIIVNSIHDIYYIYILFFLQIIKYITSFVYKQGREKIYEKYDKLSSEEVANQISEKFKQYFLNNRKYNLEKKSRLLINTAISVIYLFGGTLISNLLLLINSAEVFEIQILIVYSIILLILNYGVYCLRKHEYSRWIINTLSCIVSFIIFNEIGIISIGGFLVRIFFTVYFLSPHILYVREIIKKYQFIERKARE